MTHFITHHQTVQNSTEFPSTPPTPVLRRYDGAMAMTMALSHRIVGQGAETSSLRGDGLPGKMHGLRTGPVRWFDHHHTSLPCHPSRRLRRALLGTARWLDGLLGGQQRPRRTATSATTGWTDLLTLYAMCVGGRDGAKRRSSGADAELLRPLSLPGSIARVLALRKPQTPAP